MSYLPPVGWADVATKRDLESLQHGLESKFFEELNGQTKTLVFAMSTMVLRERSSTYANATGNESQNSASALPTPIGSTTTCRRSR